MGATPGRIRTILLLFMPFIILTSACNASASNPVSVKGTTGASTTTSTPVSNNQNIPISAYQSVTPIPGDYSLYVDPNFGYSFQYPTSWIVYPAHFSNANESDVAFTQQYTSNMEHPLLVFVVRVTNDYHHQFVQKYICSGQYSMNSTFGPYKAVDVTTDGSTQLFYGGSQTYEYGAVTIGRVFIANGLVFMVWLQASPKSHYNIDMFFKLYTPVYQHMMDSFNVGSGAKPLNSCSN